MKKWTGQALTDLLTLPLGELQQKYGHKRDYLATARYRARRKIKKEQQAAMERNPEDPEITPEMRLVSTWESITKNAEGEAEIHTLHKYDAINSEAGIEEHLFITQAAPTNITPSRRRKPQRADSLTLCAGDAQIGFRGDEPFHSERAMALFQIAVTELQPDNIIFTGDMIDLPAMSRWDQRPDWQGTTQAAIDRYHSFLAQTRANAGPDTKIVVVHGNHELRMDTFIRRDAAALLGIRRANAEHELSVLTLQYLVRYDELDIESVDGWPNAAYWLEDNIKVQHGTNVKKGGSNAAKYLAEEDTTTIFGHTHRVEVAYKTIATRLGSRTIAAASPGCLARIDGAVPGYGYSVDSSNNLVPKAPDWQNGLLVIQHNERNHDITSVRMTEDGINLLGKRYQA